MQFPLQYQIHCGHNYEYGKAYMIYVNRKIRGRVFADLSSHFDTLMTRQLRREVWHHMYLSDTSSALVDSVHRALESVTINVWSKNEPSKTPTL